MIKKLPIAVLISGSGTNLQSIIDNCNNPNFPAEIKIVISNESDAYGLIRAQKAKISTAIIDHKKFKTRKDFEDGLIKVLKDQKIKLVCLAGFMRVLTPHFLKTFSNQVINIHPALLPSFPGVDAQRQAFDYGVKVSGCTVHFVDEGTDTGPIIVQRTVPVLENDTAKTLKERILKEEHTIYPEVIRWYATDRLEIVGRKVRIKHV